MNEINTHARTLANKVSSSYKTFKDGKLNLP